MSISGNAYKALIDANFDYRDEIAALRAHIAELEQWVKMAYFEGHADACVDPTTSAQRFWQNSEARAAIAKQEGK